MISTKPAVSWRDSLPIHPAAELFPLMPPDELRVLGEDIMKNGLRSPVVLWRADDKTPAVLLDGRNRLDAIEMAPGSPVEVRNVVMLDHTTDPYAFVISTNIHRRHLTAEQKRELIATLIKATPEKSDRRIAETVKASPTTVGTVRAEMEAKGDVSKLDTRRDSKGRKQRARKPSKAEKKRNDIGATSTSEIARKDAEIKELRNAKRQLEIKITGLESEIEELRGKLATGTGGDMSISEFQTAIKKWEETVETQRSIIARLENENAKLRAGVAAPPADDGLDIPECLRRSAS